MWQVKFTAYYTKIVIEGLLLLLVLPYFFCFSINAQELGKPFIRYYSPTEYNAGAYMYEAVQGPRGRILYANSWNIRLYNGVNWDYISMNNQQQAISLAIDDDGTVYVGGNDEIGYLTPNEKGRLYCESLLPQFKDKIQNIGPVINTYTTQKGVFFQVNKAILHWNGAEAKVWSFDKKISNFLKLGGELYLVIEGEGLYLFKQGGLEEMPQMDNLRKFIVEGLLPHPNQVSPIIVTANHGLIYYDETKKGYYPFSTPINEYLKQHVASSVSVLSSGNWAIGTLRGGLVIASPIGELMCVVDKSSGLEDLQVNHIFEDKDKILWLSLANGAAKVEISTPISSWDDETGLYGEVRSVFRFRGVLHVATRRGLFYLSTDVSGHSVFHQVEALKDVPIYYTSLQNIDGEEHLLASTKKGVIEIGHKRIEEYKIDLIDERLQGYYFMTDAITQPNTVYINNNSELYTVSHTENGWVAKGPIKGLDEYALVQIEEDVFGTVWVVTARNGVVSFNIGEEHTAVNKKKYGIEQGLPAYTFIGLDHLQKQVVLTSEKGVYMHNRDTDRFEIAKKFGNQLADYYTGFYFFEEDKDGNIWYIAYQNGDEVWREWASLNEDGSYTADSTTLRRIPVMDGTRQGTFTDGEDAVWFGGTGGLFRYDRHGEMVFTHDFQAIISKITIGEGGEVLFDGTHYKKDRGVLSVSKQQVADHVITLPYEHNSLVFHFSSNNFFEERSNQFSYKIEGTDEGWSPWEPETKEHVRNMSEGTYTFRLRVRNIYGSISEEDAYAFIITPPWYRSGIAIISYIIGIILIIWLSVMFNTRRLRRQRDQLERTVQERTARIAKQKEEIEAQADNLRNANEEITAKNDVLANQQEELLTKSEEINRQNEMLEHTNKHITDSINYAGRIQQALLGGTQEIEDHFQDAFILLQPRDIVSGDFYWFSKCMEGDEEVCSILIAADCTGHGVPGAFMTVMGNALLNEIVNERRVWEPAEILQNLDQRVVSATTRQSTGVGSVNDGMDMGIVRVSHCRRFITYAGAKNPLYRIRNGEIKVFNGSKFPIGSSQFKQEKVFEGFEVDVEEGDVFYIASDGFQDQFGGPNNRKYLRKRFREFLVKIAHLPMVEQRKILAEEIDAWKADYAQTDDILVIGFTVGCTVTN